MKKYFTNHRDFLLLFILIGISASLRLYGITEQSVWHEEFVYVANIKVCDLWTNIKLLFINVPEYGISPGALILYYFWIRVFPETIWLWRILPISFGIFSIILIYYFGKWLRNWKVGFFAGLIAGISPFNIYIHQELKSYSFVLFLALLSWFSFIRYLFNENKKIWLYVSFTANLLLPWFHAIYITIPILQVPLYIWKEKNIINAIRSKFYWIFLNFFVLFPYLMWIYWINPPAYNLTLAVKEKITPKFMVESLFGVDCVGISNELFPHWKTNSLEILKSLIWRNVFQYWALIDYFMLTFIILFSVRFCFHVINNLFTKKYCNYYNDNNVIKKVFLLYILFSSPFILCCLGIVTDKPLFLPLYFYHCFSVLYLIVIIAIFDLEKKIIMVSSMSILILLFLAQCSSLINFVTRPDYKSAVAYLDKNVGKDDTVLDLALGANVFEPWRLYKSRADYTIRPVFSLQAIVEKALKKETNSEKINDDRDVVWVLMETTFINWLYKTDPTYLLVKHLSPVGFKVDIKHFPGKFNLYVLKIERHLNKKLEQNQIIIPPFGNFDYVKLMNELTLMTGNNMIDQRTKETLSRYFAIYPVFYPYNYVLIINSMLEDGELFIAEKICDYLISQSGGFNHILFLKGIIYVAQGEKEKANKVIHLLFSKNYFFESMYSEILEKKNYFITDSDIILFKELESKGYHILNKPIMTVFYNQSIK